MPFRLLSSEDPLLYFSGLALHVRMPLSNSTATVPDAAREALEAEWLDRDAAKPLKPSAGNSSLAGTVMKLLRILVCAWLADVGAFLRSLR